MQAMQVGRLPWKGSRGMGAVSLFPRRWLCAVMPLMGMGWLVPQMALGDMVSMGKAPASLAMVYSAMVAMRVCLVTVETAWEYWLQSRLAQEEVLRVSMAQLLR